MANVADSAVGAILEIPPKALSAINQAEKALIRLHDQSKKTADQVYGDFSKRMSMGVAQFINQLQKAKREMDNLGTVNVTLNTTAAVQSGKQLSEQMHKTSSDVSKAAQDMAKIDWNKLAKVDISKVDTIELNTLQRLKNELERIKQLRETTDKDTHVPGVGTPQDMTNYIRQIEEVIRLWKLSAEEKNKAVSNIAQKQQNEKDKAYLDEQKRLLDRILQLRKDISQISISVQRGTITGKSDMSADLAQLEQLRKELRETGSAYRDLRTSQSKDISNEARIQAQIQSQKAKTDGLRQELVERDKLNAAITRANELTAQGQQGKSRLGSGEEAAIQRQLNSDYKNQLKILKEIGDIKAKAAEQGRGVTQQEIALIQSLAQRYRIYSEDVKRVETAYAAMGNAARRNFEADRSEQLARNAIMLADAQRKATEAAQKHGLVLRETTSIESKIQAVTEKINQEKAAWANVEQRVKDAQAAVDAFKNANPNFNTRDAELKLESLKEKIHSLYEQLGTGLSPKREGLINQEINQLKQEFNSLDEKLLKSKIRFYELADAEDNAKNANSRYSQAIDSLQANLNRLQNELTNIRNANASINAEIGKGSTVKSLSSEYANLTKRLQEVNNAMNNYLSAGGKTTNASYQALEQEYLAIMQRRKEIERMDIAEVNQYRTQMAQQAYQADLSTFVQYIAQKKDAAIKAAQEQAIAQQEAQRKYLQTAQGAMWQARQVTSGKGTGDFATNLENIKRAINDLKTASGKLNLLDPKEAKKAEQLKNKIAELETLLKRYKDAATPDKPVINPNDAIQAAKTATTLRGLEKAYKDLKEAMANTSPSKTAWADMNAQAKETKKSIDDIKKKMGEFQKQSQQTSNIMGQLQSRIATAFSVAAITGFVKKVTEVRAQFELQRVALGAIIQDRDEANKIFLQVQQMALESPFSIMQLERATKQTAAFGFEAKKLVPTMKMFADLGAGLGVELERITLVMGHLKARGYLEGTMVRQFTNMGFNVLGELAKYYTELEDRMVSVSEVQTRVKKKMVEFGDVEEVLRRVTSAGGMFYDMQKKQSDSIWGQMQRIRDAYDLMLNEVGQSNEGMIKWGLSSIRELINSWRALKPYIVSAVAAMGSYGVIAAGWHIVSTAINGSKIAIIALTKGIQAAKAAQQGLNVTMAANPYAAVISLLVMLGVYLWQAKNATSALNEELDRIGANMTDSLNESIVTFKQLADTISDTSATFTERTEALTEMKRVYAEILPKEKMEIEYIKSLKGNYDELNKTIKEYYQDKEYNQKIEAVQGSEEAKAVKKQLQETLERMNEDGMFDLKYSKSQISSWADTIAKEINTGKIPASLDSLEKRIKEVFNAKDLSKYRSEEYGEADMHDVMQEVEKVTKAYGDLSVSTAMAENAAQSYSDSLKNLDFSQLNKGLNDLKEQRAQLKMSLGIPLDKGEYITDWNFEKPHIDATNVEDYKKSLKAVEEQIKATEEAQAKWLANQYKEKIIELNNVLEKDVVAYWDAKRAMELLERQGKKNTKEWESQKKAMDEAKASADKTADTYNTKVTWSLINSADTSHELRTELDSLATKAFPKVSQLAAKSMNKVVEYLLKGKKTMLGWLKMLGDILPDNLKESLPGAAKMFASIDENLKLTESQLNELAKAANESKSSIDATGDSLEGLYSSQVKKRVTDAGADISTINDIVFDTNGKLKKGAEETANALRNNAKRWRDDAEKYRTTTDKKFFLESNKLTEEQIKLNEKNAAAAEKLASDLDGIESKKTKSKRGGEDPIKKLWNERLDALNKYYDAAEKARKHLSVQETATTQKSSFKDLWDSLGMNDVQGLSLPDLISKGFDPNKMKSDYVSALKDLLKFIPLKYTELRNKVQETISSKSIEISFKIKEDEEKKLKADIDNLFDNYELTKTLDDANIDVNLAFMVGGKPMSLDDIRKSLTEGLEAAGGKNAPKNIYKEYEDAFKKLDDIELKEKKERLKDYNKYLAQSYGDAAKIQLKYYADLTAMQEDFNKMQKDGQAILADPDASEDEKKRVKELLESLPKQAKRAAIQMRKEMETELAKMNFDKILNSPLFSEMFQDLATLSNKVLDSMIAKIETISKDSKNLSLSQIRQLAQYSEKLSKAKIDNSPFKESAKAIKEAYDLRRSGITPEKASNNLAISQEELTNMEQYKDNLSFVLGLMEKGYQIDGNNLVLGKEKVKLTEEQVDLYNAANETGNGAKYLQLELEYTEKLIDAKTGEVILNKKRVQTYKDAEYANQKLAAALQEAGKVGTEALEGIVACVEAFGGNISDADKIWIDFVKNMLAQCITLAVAFIALGIQITEALGIIGLIGAALSVVLGLIQAVLGAHDARLQKEIDDLEDGVEKLSRAFEKLKDTVDNAFNAVELRSASQEGIRNLQEQISKKNQEIMLEMEKKDPDDERIKELNKEIEDLNDEMEEFKNSVTQSWGGFGGKDAWASASEEFASVWLDAFKETGDGLSALEDKWDEYIDNLLIKQMKLRIVSNRLKKLYEMVDAAVSEGSAGGENLTKEELDSINKAKSEVLAQLNQDLKNFADLMGIKGGAGENILSDLQKGIQNITEPQAAAIEAYMNSIRFEVFKHTEQLNTLINSINAQYGSNDSPILKEVKEIRNILSRIDTNLSRVILQRNAQSQYVVKVGY